MKRFRADSVRIPLECILVVNRIYSVKGSHWPNETHGIANNSVPFGIGPSPARKSWIHHWSLCRQGSSVVTFLEMPSTKTLTQNMLFFVPRGTDTSIKTTVLPLTCTWMHFLHQGKFIMHWPITTNIEPSPYLDRLVNHCVLSIQINGTTSKFSFVHNTNNVGFKKYLFSNCKKEKNLHV